MWAGQIKKCFGQTEKELDHQLFFLKIGLGSTTRSTSYPPTVEGGLLPTVGQTSRDELDTVVKTGVKTICKIHLAVCKKDLERPQQNVL